LDRRVSSPAPSRRGAWPAIWALLLTVVLLWPALGPGLVLSYDMVWVPDLSLRPDFLGVGSGLPRAVPSDAAVSVLDELVPGWLLQKLVLVVPLAGGAPGVVRLLGEAPLVARLVAVSVFVWNPFVAERLVMGHWTVLLGYGVLPWVLVLGRRWRLEGRVPAALPVLVVVGSLSASAGIATAVAVVASVGLGRRLRTLAVLALVAAANAPWVASGLLHAAAGRSDPAGAAAFALAGEGSVPAPLAALTLGGIWNSEVVPASRTDVLGWLALLVLLAAVAIGARRWWAVLGRRDALSLLVCWGVGLALALLTWASPDLVAWSAAHVPGGGLLRDGSRLLVLCVPLVATLAGVATARLLGALDEPAARLMTAAALVLLPVLLLPDAALGMAGRLQAVDFPEDYENARTTIQHHDEDGDVLLLPLSSYRRPGWNEDHKVLDPTGRYQTRDFVTSDELVVSRTVLAGEDPRVAEMASALAAPSPGARSAALAEAGIAIVVTDLEAPGEVPALTGRTLYDGRQLVVTAIDGARARPVRTGWVATMAVAWAVFLGCPLWGATVASARRLRRRAGP
jgi:hypothetical protein